jgi:3-methyladenine DNA glycosylase AlkD
VAIPFHDFPFGLRMKPSSTSADVQQHLKTLASPAVAMQQTGYFKTGPGQYGEGDVFIGIRVPVLRKTAKQFQSLPLPQITKLLRSKIHEERLLALMILVSRFEKGDSDARKEIYDLYLANTEFVNNWDLVDSSAPGIVGAYLVDRSRAPLKKLAKSKSLWERRIAIIATQHFNRLGQIEAAIAISRLLLKDEHDLIHKATGWMLREVGVKDRDALVQFLLEHGKEMPRTMLRYAIEHFSAEERKRWMARGQD